MALRTTWPPLQGRQPTLEGNRKWKGNLASASFRRARVSEKMEFFDATGIGNVSGNGGGNGASVEVEAFGPSPGRLAVTFHRRFSLAHRCRVSPVDLVALGPSGRLGLGDQGRVRSGLPEGASLRPARPRRFVRTSLQYRAGVESGRRRRFYPPPRRRRCWPRVDDGQTSPRCVARIGRPTLTGKASSPYRSAYVLAYT